ncbi:hypothetical protein K525DRAFT_212310 [Schizophyllum commune Loenen D]|nr:hypothetical protein K525DRAFT_212310 [Schizophyllum commune Loenen D]
MFRPSFIRRLIRENLARASATASQRGHEGSSSVNDPPPAPLLRPVDLPAVSPSGDGPSHVRSSCAVPPSRADASADLPPLVRSAHQPRPEEALIGPSQDSRSHGAPTAPHIEDRGNPSARSLRASNMTVHAMDIAGRSAPVLRYDMTSRLPRSSPNPPPPRPRASPALPATRDQSLVLNIYSDNMLPQSSPAGSAPLPDTHWAGYDKEVINAMMPLDLYRCFLIFLSAPRLQRIQFWRINANKNPGKLPEVRVPALESLIIRDTETQLKDLLRCLYFKKLNYLEVYYSSGCLRRFQADQTAYYNLFSSRRHMAEKGDMVILPNDPAYSERSSSLEGRLQKRSRARFWRIRVTDMPS